MMRILLVVLALLSTNGYGRDLLESLKDRNELFLSYEKLQPFFRDEAVRSRLSKWFSHQDNRSYVVECQFWMRAFFRSESVVAPLCYYLKRPQRGDRNKALEFANLYLKDVEAALWEISSDPGLSLAEKSKAKRIVTQFPADSQGRLASCLKPALEFTYPEGELMLSPFNMVAKCFHRSFPKFGQSPVFAVNLRDEFTHHPGRVVTPAGWISGNKVTYLHWNETSTEEQHRLELLHPLMQRHYPLEGRGSLAAMRAADLSKVFSAEEGFFTVDNDPVWTKNKPGAIFPEFVRALRAAKTSVFLDIFFLGGSMGASFAKELVATAERGVKVFVLRDNYNHFGHEPEMLPVYNYLAAYAYKNPEKMVVSGSYIKAHTSGLPQVIAQNFDPMFLSRAGLDRHLSLYAGAKSDHSKVMVVDGATEKPVAFVGSKNFTDASGAIVYDEVVKVEGPAAAVVLDDYYFDMQYALQYELDGATLARFAQQGWSKDKFRSGQSKSEMIRNVLAPFDLLARDSKRVAHRSDAIAIANEGSAWVRSGYNNVNSSRTNCVTQVVQMILGAKEKILIKDQYLFDRTVVNALLLAKHRRPSLDIKILLEPLNRAAPKGMPNLLYLDLLKSAGIAIKWKTLIPGHGKIHQEYHMKTISADGQHVISGSANKDQTTMYGSFREQQLHVYDLQATKVHDQILMAAWNDSAEEFTGYQFDVPHNLVGLNGKKMTPEEFIAALRGVVSLLYDAASY